MTETIDNNPFTPPQAPLQDASGGADTRFTLNLFSPGGRIGRIRYLAYSMGLSLLIMLGGLLVSLAVGEWFIVLAYVFMFYCHIMLAIKRCHDFNSSGWLSILSVVPLISLIFLFIPGTDGPNRFGNKTAPNGKAAVAAILLVIGVGLIGMLAAIAIPAYKTYADKARAAQMR